MGQLDFLDVNDAKIEELWKRYLSLRGLTSGSDPIPAGESPIDFRRKWEKYLYAQSPSGAAATQAAPTGGGSVTVVEKPKPNIPNGGFYGDPQEAVEAGKVVFFEHKDFSGAMWVWGVGQKAVMATEPGSQDYISNDTISSVMVPPGLELWAYEHINFGGKMRKITGNVAFLGDEWNDLMSSFQVRKAPTAQGRGSRR